MVAKVAPAHNAAGMLRRCYEPVRAKTLTGWEHIVVIVDDAFTDGTSALLDQLRKSVGRC